MKVCNCATPALRQTASCKGTCDQPCYSNQDFFSESGAIERHSRYVMLVKVANKDPESVVSLLIKQSQRLPSELYRSLTWAEEKELAADQSFPVIRPRHLQW